MAQPIAEAFVEIKARTGKYKANIAGIKRTTVDFGKAASKSVDKVTGSLGIMGKAVRIGAGPIKRALKTVALGFAAVGVAAGIAATVITVKLTKALVRAGKASVAIAVRFDKLKRGLTAVMKGAENARRELVNLREVARMPGLGLVEAIQGSINLQAVGFSAKGARDILLSFGNALVTVGKGKAELDGVSLALTQMKAKGKILAEEINQLAERVPQVRKVMIEAFGTGAAEDIQKMGISVDDFIAKMVEGLNKLPKVTGGIALSLENLEDNFKLLKITLGNLLLPAVTKVTDGLATIVEKLTDVVDGFKAYRDEATAILTNVAVIGVRTTAGMLKGMSKLILIAAKTIWKPLALGAAAAFIEIEFEGIKLIGKLGRAMRVFSKERLAEFNASVEKSKQKFIKFAEVSANIEFNTELAKGIAEAEQVIRDMTTTFFKGVKDVNTELGKFPKSTNVKAYTDDVKAAGEGTKGFALAFKDVKAVGGFLDNPITGLQNYAAELKKLKALPSIAELIKPTPTSFARSFKASFGRVFLGDISPEMLATGKRASEKLNEGLAEGARQFGPFLRPDTLRESEKRIRNFNKDIADDTKDRQNKITEKLKGNIRDREKLLKKAADFRKAALKQQAKLIEEQRAKMQAFAREFRFAFEDLFAGMLSGDKKEVWTRFWDDLKAIAIMKLAEIAASQVFNKVIDAISQEQTGTPQGKEVAGGIVAGLLKRLGVAIIGNAILPGAGGAVASQAAASAGLLGPGFAKGGIFRKPTFGMIGEKGPEAVIPLNDARAFGRDNGGGITIENITFNETDFGNIDRMRLQKDVIQQIMPVIQQAVADGIGG